MSEKLNLLSFKVVPFGRCGIACAIFQNPHSLSTQLEQENAAADAYWLMERQDEAATSRHAVAMNDVFICKFRDNQMKNK